MALPEPGSGLNETKKRKTIVIGRRIFFISGASKTNAKSDPLREYCLVLNSIHSTNF